jgi:hypothetical protein
MILMVFSKILLNRIIHSMGEMGRWGDGEMGRWGDGEMGRWGWLINGMPLLTLSNIKVTA